MAYQSIHSGANVDAAITRALAGGAIDQEIALKAPIASPALTGTPTAPTQATGDNSTKIATTEYADRAIMASLITESVGPSAVASFSDGADNIPVKNLTAQIVPIQDLHGYDYPWPEGGGKNKLPMTLTGIKAINTTGTWNGNTYTIHNITYTINVDSNDNVIGITVNSIAAASSTANLYFVNGMSLPAGTYIMNGGYNSNTYVKAVVDGNSYTSEGSDVSFDVTSESVIGDIFVRTNVGTSPSGVSIKPMIRVSGTNDTFVPYSNVCAMSGWTGANIYKTGKNLCPKSTTGTTAQVTYTVNEDGTISLSGTSNSSYAWRKLAEVWLKAGTTYKLSGAPANGGGGKWSMRLRVPDVEVSPNDDGSGATFTPTVSAMFNLEFLVYYGATVTGKTIKPMVTLGDAEQTYEPYNGTTYAIDWTDEAGTILGGTLKVTDGAVRNQRVIRAFNGTENWSESGSVGNGLRYVCTRNTYIPYATTDGQLSSHLRYNANNGAWGVYRVSTSNIVISDGNGYFGSVENFKQWLVDQYTAGTPLQISTTKSAAAQADVSIIPVEIKSLKGNNVIWADCGDVSVDYRADTKLYIQKVIQEG